MLSDSWCGRGCKSVHRSEQNESGNAMPTQATQIPTGDELEQFAHHLATTQEWLLLLRLDQAANPAEAVVTQTEMLEKIESNMDELRAAQEMLAQARQAVEAERQRYLDLFEFAPHGYLVSDAQGIITE